MNSLEDTENCNKGDRDKSKRRKTDRTSSAGDRERERRLKQGGRRKCPIRVFCRVNSVRVQRGAELS